MIALLKKIWIAVFVTVVGFLFLGFAIWLVLVDSDFLGGEGESSLLGFSVLLVFFLLSALLLLFAGAVIFFDELYPPSAKIMAPLFEKNDEDDHVGDYY